MLNASRRDFLVVTGAAVFAGNFNVPFFSTNQSDFQVGYHAVTWGDQIEQAIEDLSALGFRGVQIRVDDYRKYANRVGEFKELIAAKKLTLVSLSSDRVTLNPKTEKQELEEYLAMAKWMKAVGGLYLQVADRARVKEGVNDPDDYRKLGKRLAEIGKRTLGEYGVKLGYHNQMDSLGERPDEVDRILDAADPKYIWAVVDIAHIQVAGGDPVKFMRNYVNRLIYPHFKDVVIHPRGPATMDGKQARPKYDFVELGQGKVNVPAVLQMMRDYHWHGWIIIELDRAPGGHTPRESATISKKYLEEKLKLVV